jgi:hypothetical protein
LRNHEIDEKDLNNSPSDDTFGFRMIRVASACYGHQHSTNSTRLHISPGTKALCYEVSAFHEFYVYISPGTRRRSCCVLSIHVYVTYLRCEKKCLATVLSIHEFHDYISPGTWGKPSLRGPQRSTDSTPDISCGASSRRFATGPQHSTNSTSTYLLVREEMALRVLSVHDFRISLVREEVFARPLGIPRIPRRDISWYEKKVLLRVLQHSTIPPP